MRRGIHTLCMAVAILFLGCATTPEALYPSAADVLTVVRLEKTLYFTSPDGQHVRAVPGDYRVESRDVDQLHFTAPDVGTFVIVAADKNGHDLPLSAPVVVTFAKQDHNQHILLRMEDGTVWETIGSTTLQSS